MIVDGPDDEHNDHYQENETPVFREPKWSPVLPTPADDSGRPVLLQPSTDEDGMKRHDKSLVARLDRGSSSSDSTSASPASPEKMIQSCPASSDDLDSEEHAPHGTPGEEHEYRGRSSQSLLNPSQPQQHRVQQQHRRPAPLSLHSSRTSTSHQAPRLPPLSRLVPTDATSESKQTQQQSQHNRPQDPRRFPRVSNPAALNSPAAYQGFTPIQVIPPWQSFPYGWTPMSMPLQYPMAGGPVASPHQIYAPQFKRVQHPQTPSATSVASTSSLPSPAPQLREDLWKVGSTYLSSPANADAFVRAVEIRQGSLVNTSVAVTSREDGMEMDDEPHSITGDISKNPFGNGLLLRVVIHSPGRASIAMTREFERDKLRDTIPDFARSPKSPKSSTSAGSNGTTGGSVSTPLSGLSTLSLARRRKSQIRAQHQAGVSPTPSSAGPTRRLAMPPVPVRK